MRPITAGQQARAIASPPYKRFATGLHHRGTGNSYLMADGKAAMDIDWMNGTNYRRPSHPLIQSG
jgi:hypothetical protein